MRGIGKADRGYLHASAVSRYDALKRGINGASETVVIDVSFFTGSCLAIRRRVQRECVFGHIEFFFVTN
jgi:hypothetical protein